MGVLQTSQALRIARERSLDLIEISPNSKPPVCKLGDFGKYNYEKQKREKEQKKNKGSQVKEIRFHPNTDTHDLEFKCRHLREFLIQGHKVKATVIFIGRMMLHQEIGINLLNKVIEKLSDISRIEMQPRLEGRNLNVILIPERKKIEQIKRAREKEKSVLVSENK
jgi:translation initiation factor IF-3